MATAAEHMKKVNEILDKETSTDWKDGIILGAMFGLIVGLAIGNWIF